MEDNDPNAYSGSSFSMPPRVGVYYLVSLLTNYYHTLVKSQAEGKLPPYFGPSYRKSWRARKAVAKAQVLTQLGRPADDDEE